MALGTGVSWIDDAQSLTAIPTIAAEKCHKAFLASSVSNNNALVANPALENSFYFGSSEVWRIYIRSAYATILPQLGLNRQTPASTAWIMLTGTPGVGKSLFAIYLTHLIVHNEVNMISSIKKVCFIQKTEADIRTLYFIKDEDDHWRAV